MHERRHTIHQDLEWGQVVMAAWQYGGMDNPSVEWAVSRGSDTRLLLLEILQLPVIDGGARGVGNSPPPSSPSLSLSGTCMYMLTFLASEKRPVLACMDK